MGRRGVICRENMAKSCSRRALETPTRRDAAHQT
jgi:hypothetical protein